MIVRVMLLQEVPPAGRGRSLPSERVVQEFEVECRDLEEGTELLDGIADYIEAEGYNFDEDDDE